MAQRRPQSRPLYTGLRVRNLDRSIRFYKVLGFRPVLRRKTSLGEFVILEHPFRHFSVELNQYRPGSQHFEAYKSGSEMDHLGVWVDDVDRCILRLTRAGGRLKWKPYEAVWPVPPGWPVREQSQFAGRAAWVTDPDGIWIELMGPRRATPRA